jgi:Man1-Src1p-C-terminal domain
VIGTPAAATTIPTPSSATGHASSGSIHHEEEDKNIIPAPPRQFPTTATTPQTNSEIGDIPLAFQHPPTVTTTKETPEAYLTPESVRVQAQPRSDVPNKQEQNHDVAVHSDAVEKAAGSSVLNQVRRVSRWVGMYVGLPFLVMCFLFYCLSTKKYGIFMISGLTSRHCSTNYIGRCHLEPPYVVVTEDETPIVQVTQRCYYDSPEHLLEMLNASVKDAMVEFANCTNGIQECPLHAICYKGRMLGCQAPAWVIDSKDNDDTDNPEVCVLSKVVNDTYSGLVELVESWSIQYLCFNRAEIPTPISFYSYIKSDKDPFNAIAVAPADETTVNGFMSSSDGGIPLYPWTSIHRMIKGPEELEAYWDWNLLQNVNNEHKKQLFLGDESGDVLLVGLTPNRYKMVEQAKLPTSCKWARGIVHSFDWVGRFILSLFSGCIGVIAYCFRFHPYMSVSVTAVVNLVWYWRYRNAKYKRERKLVNEIRIKVVQKLRTAMNNQQASTGMRRGEVAAIHLRDEICYEMYDDDKKRATFKSVVWPMVCYEIHSDNRVGKSHRMVAGSKRDLWTWVATPAAGEEVSQR